MQAGKIGLPDSLRQFIINGARHALLQLLRRDGEERALARQFGRAVIQREDHLDIAAIAHGHPFHLFGEARDEARATHFNRHVVRGPTGERRQRGFFRARDQPRRANAQREFHRRTRRHAMQIDERSASANLSLVGEGEGKRAAPGRHIKRLTLHIQEINAILAEAVEIEAKLALSAFRQAAAGYLGADHQALRVARRCGNALGAFQKHLHPAGFAGCAAHAKIEIGQSLISADGSDFRHQAARKPNFPTARRLTWDAGHGTKGRAIGQQIRNNGASEIAHHHLALGGRAGIAHIGQFTIARRERFQDFLDFRIRGLSAQAFQLDARELGHRHIRQHFQFHAEFKVTTIGEAGHLDLWLQRGLQATIADHLAGGIAHGFFQHFTHHGSAVALAHNGKRHLARAEARQRNRLGDFGKALFAA